MCRRAIGWALFVVGALASAGRANDWKKLNNQPGASASTMLLLMDGRVLCHDSFTTHWWILTPGPSGSYLNGTWSQAADSRYDRLYYASGVLADGRVIVAGGEYSNNGGSDKTEIYDPVADAWTTVASPSGWGYIGDAPSVVLADGRFMLGSITDGRTAIYDPVADAWTASASKLNGDGVEETWALLPDGTVVVADCVGHPGSELYDPVLDVWVDLGAMPIDLVDSSLEIGPGLCMNDGRAFFMGATPHCALYTASTTPGGVGSWIQGVDPPTVSGVVVVAKDAPGSILPSGNILLALGPGFSPPTYFFEYDGTAFVRAPDPGNNNGPPYVGRMMLLPNGKVLFASGSVWMYSPDGGPDSAWRPTISSVASDLIPGESYLVSGTQLNGLTTAVAYGDDANSATNYPIVRLFHLATGHVTYCRAFNPSTMAIATGSATVSTHFVVPPGTELGPARLEVVANGIASAGVSVMVRDAVTIDFDALAAGVVVTNQFAEATFSSEPGYENQTAAQNAGSSQPNVICSAPVGGAVDCSHATYVDFPCAVASLTLSAVGVDGVGPVATVNVFQGATLAGSVAVEGAGDASVPVRVDLTAFADVTRIELGAISDVGGIAWDDFRFCLASTASWNNYGSGFPGTSGVPAFTLEQAPVIGTTITADLGNSSGTSTIAVALVGTSEASLPTGKGGDLLVVPLFSILLPLGPTGTTIVADIVDDSALCGLAIYAQALEVDAGAAYGLSFSAGLKLLLGY